MKKAFSLIELLIVVTIIAVLTGAALPFVGEYLEQSKTAKAKNDLDEISRAINAFEVTTGLAYTDTTGNVLKGRFLQKLPIDPWGTPYGFASATEANGATVYSAGPDHIAGNADDITVSYKGPLAVVSARWSDVNGDGQISPSSSSFPSTDTLIVRFNRQVHPDSIASFGTDAGATTTFITGAKSFQVLFGNTAATNTPTLSSDGRTLTFFFATTTSDVDPAAFIIGSDTMSISTHITDAGGTPAIAASVTVLAQ